jgi:hypothetical protein
VPHLPVAGNVGIMRHKFFDSSASPVLSRQIVSQSLIAEIEGIVTIGSGFEKKYRREKPVFIEDAQNIPERRQLMGRRKKQWSV